MKDMTQKKTLSSIKKNQLFTGHKPLHFVVEIRMCIGNRILDHRESSASPGMIPSFSHPDGEVRWHDSHPKNDIWKHIKHLQKMFKSPQMCHKKGKTTKMIYTFVLYVVETEVLPTRMTPTDPWKASNHERRKLTRDVSRQLLQNLQHILTDAHSWTVKLLLVKIQRFVSGKSRVRWLPDSPGIPPPSQGRQWSHPHFYWPPPT